MKAKNVTEGSAAPAAARPSAKAGQGIEIVTDSLGRKISLRKLSASQRFLVDERIEAKTLSAGMQIKFVGSVIAIDDDGWPALETREELLHRLDELGDEGLDAITGPCMKMYGLEFTADDKAKAKN